MNWVDLVVLTVLALSGLLALMRGFVREVLGVGAWVLAGVIAGPYGVFPHIQPYVRQQFNDPSTADIVGFGSVFLISLIVLWIVAGVVGNLVRSSVLGGLDRTLGLLFGLVRGAALISVAYILAGIALPADQWPPPVQESRILPLAYKGAVLIADQVPQTYRPAVTTPPAGRATNAASLLQPPPSGRALTRPDEARKSP